MPTPVWVKKKQEKDETLVLNEIISFSNTIHKQDIQETQE